MIGALHQGIIAAARVGSAPGPAVDWWQPLPMAALTTETTGWSNNTLRVVFVAGAVTGSAVRIKFRAPASTSFTVSKVYVQAGANVYQFKAPPVEMKFGGASGFSIAPGTSITSDACAVTLAPGDTLVVAMHIVSGTLFGKASPTNSFFLFERNYYESGDDASNQVPTGYTSTLSGLHAGIESIEFGQPDPVWNDIWAPSTARGTSSSWGGYTLRVVIPSALFSSESNFLRAWFSGASSNGSGQFNVVAAFVGLSAGSPAYAFSATPVPLLFDTSSSVELLPGTLTKTDPAALFIDGSASVVLSFYVTMPVGRPFGTNTPAGWGCFYKSGNDAATVGASGYTSYTDFPSFCRLQVTP